MIPYIKSENLKFKRTFSRKLVFIAPICFALFSYLVSYSLNDPQNSFNAMALNWWALIFVPLGTAVLCVLSDLTEKTSFGYISILSRRINKRAFFISKMVVVDIYILISSLFLLIILFVSNYLLFGSFSNLSNIFFSILISFIISVSLTPINLFISYKTSILVTLILNFIFLILGIIFSTKDYWFIMPWGFALRLMCPIARIHPNGTFLPYDSPLLDNSVIFIGIFISAIFCIASCIIATNAFKNQEVD